MALITISELKEYLDISGTGQDALLTNIVNRASDVLRAYLGRNIEQATYTNEEHNGGLNTVITKNRPIISITVLKDNGNTVAADDYVFYAESGVIELRTGTFTSGLKKVSVTYDAGYSTIPEVLKQAALEVATLIYKDTDAGDGRAGKSGVSIPQVGNLNLHRKLQPATCKALWQYAEMPF